MAIVASKGGSLKQNSNELQIIRRKTQISNLINYGKISNRQRNYNNTATLLKITTDQIENKTHQVLDGSLHHQEQRLTSIMKMARGDVSSYFAKYKNTVPRTNQKSIDATSKNPTQDLSKGKLLSKSLPNQHEITLSRLKIEGENQNLEGGVNSNTEESKIDFEQRAGEKKLIDFTNEELRDGVESSSITKQKKVKGLMQGVVLKNKDGDRVFAKSESSQNPLRAIFGYKVLYNLGFGAKTEFFSKTPIEEDLKKLNTLFYPHKSYCVLSKGLAYSKNESSKRDFFDSQEQNGGFKNKNGEALGVSREALSNELFLLSSVSNILALGDVKESHNIGIVKKIDKEGKQVIEGKIYDFLLTDKSSFDIERGTFDTGKYSSHINIGEAINSRIKIKKEDGERINPSERRNFPAEKKASFQDTLAFSKEQALQDYKKIFGEPSKQILKELEEYIASCTKRDNSISGKQSLSYRF